MLKKGGLRFINTPYPIPVMVKVVKKWSMVHLPTTSSPFHDYFMLKRVVCVWGDSVMVRASASEAGGHGFEPGPRHTKDVKNGTSGYLAWRSAFIRLALASPKDKKK